jgi:class 3 adenylate cyclase
MESNKEDRESLKDLLQSLDEVEAKIEERRSERCVMFVDLVGYTSYVDRCGDVAGRRRVQKAGDVTLPIAERYGGRVAKGLGDGWMLLFTSANDAVRSAVEIERENHEAQRLEPEPAELKIGLDFGRLLEESDDIYGDVVNVSSRLASKCEGESILISHRVFEALDPFYQQRCDPMEGMMIRGKSRSATAYQVRWRLADDGTTARHTRKLVVEVLWSDAESRVALTGGVEREDSLISYQTHSLALEEILSVDSCNADSLWRRLGGVAAPI